MPNPIKPDPADEHPIPPGPPCLWCNGDGERFNGYRCDPCGHCAGTGIEQSPQRLTCPHCKGIGHEMFSTAATPVYCHLCFGRGTISDMLASQLERLSAS
jgi:DnaJ-class molecular chaperone